MSERRDRWALPLLILLAFVGAGISLMLTSFHLSQGKDPWRLLELTCGAEGEGCAEVLASGWAVLPGGIPVAALGLVYFGSLGLWYAVVGRANRRGRAWQALPLMLNGAGVLVSVFFLGVMLTRIHAICWWCTVSHLINFALFYLAWKIWPQEEAAPGEPARPGVRLGLAGVLLMIALAAITLDRLAVSSMRNLAEQANEYARTFFEDMDLQGYLHLRQAAVEIPLRPDDPVRGNPAASHTVVVFSDFQCPACRGFASFAEQLLLPRFGDRVKLVYRHYPLEPECNPGLPREVHPEACQAAYAAEAARQAGGPEAFWLMHDLMFRQQELLPQSPWADLASRAGVDGNRLARQVAAGFGKERILEDAAVGRRLNLDATPTVYLDGRKLESWTRPELWEALLK